MNDEQEEADRSKFLKPVEEEDLSNPIPFLMIPPPATPNFSSSIRASQVS